MKPPFDDFGFAVAAHPLALRDSATASFVPAIKDEMRVPRDGALSLSLSLSALFLPVHAHERRRQDLAEILANGLPHRDAFDLVYRHGLDVDERGELVS